MSDLDFTPLIWVGAILAILPSFGVGLLVGWWLL